MQLPFFKYQGTGNDFVLIDNRQGVFPSQDTSLIANFCDRKFGVGADGLILLEEDTFLDFKMVYFNADGKQSTMCGNGGRCIVHFAAHLGLIESKTQFKAIDGLHSATILNNIVTLRMASISEILHHKTFSFLNTGSPHHVEMVTGLNDFDVFNTGKAIRNDRYGVEGSNVNFVEKISEDTFAVRTYERGVEDETLSCGTGVTAVAIAMHDSGITKASKVALHTPGGKLSVSFTKEGDVYNDVVLEGPATQVFKGFWNL